MRHREYRVVCEPRARDKQLEICRLGGLETHIGFQNHCAENNCPKPRSSNVTQRYTCLARRTGPVRAQSRCLHQVGQPAEARICWVGFGLSLTGFSAAPPLSSNSLFKQQTHLERRAIDGRDRIHRNVHMIPTAPSGRLGGTVQQGVMLRLRSRNLWMTKAWW